MYKLTVFVTLIVLAFAHPINHALVDEIRAKTTSWMPHDPHTNPLGEYTNEQLLGMLGSYIVPINGVYPHPQVVATPNEFDPRT